MQRTFATPGPTSVYVELGAGRVTVRAEETDETRVDVHGDGADDTVVEQRGNQIVVIGPKLRTGFLRSSSDLSVQIHLPTDSELTTRLGSADLTVSGRLGEARLKSGSGDVEVAEISGDAVVEAGSGTIRVGAAAGELRARAGSGHVTLGRVDASVAVATGSGDIEIGTAAGPVNLRSGSGDARIGDGRGDVVITTASGDVAVNTFQVGSLRAKAVSGDIRIGVPAGVPVWTDISTVTGHIASSLDGAGEPAEGQPHIELRATTVSGDVRLEQL